MSNSTKKAILAGLAIAATLFAIYGIVSLIDESYSIGIFLNHIYTLKIFRQPTIPEQLALVLLGGAWLIIAFIYVQAKLNAGTKTNVGTAAMATSRELKTLAGSDGLVLGRELRLSQKTDFEHIACIGPTGSGKSTTYFIPNLLMLPSNASIVVSDPKGELYEKTAGWQKKIGREPIIFAPFNADKSYRYDPIQNCSTVTELKELSQTIILNGSKATEITTGGSMGGIEWLNMSMPLLSSLLIYAKHTNTSLNEVIDIILTSKTKDIEAIISKSGSEDAYTEFNVFKQVQGSEKTEASIKIVLASNLGLFTDPAIKKVIEGNPQINFKQLREKPTALYVQVPERRSIYTSPLMSVFYSQCISSVLDTPGLPVYFLLDEFANIGVIPSFANLAATARSRQVSLSIGIQGIEQLERNYGKENADDILNNMKVKLFYPGLATYTAEYASKTCGYSTAKVKGQDNKWSPQKTELLTPDEIRRLEDGKLLVIAHNRNPIIINQLRYYNDRSLREKTAYQPPEIRIEAIKVEEDSEREW